MRAALIALAGCSVYQPASASLRRVEVGGPAVTRPQVSTEVEIDDQTFTVGPWLQPGVTLMWLATDGEPIHRRTTITIDRWRIECETIHSLALDEEYLFRTTNMETTCTSEGTPQIDLFMEGAYDVFGLIVVGTREYQILIDPEDGDRRALLVLRDGQPYLVVAHGNRIWMRAGIDREERKALLKVAVALWASAQVRET